MKKKEIWLVEQKLKKEEAEMKIGKIKYLPKKQALAKYA